MKGDSIHADSYVIDWFQFNDLRDTPRIRSGINHVQIGEAKSIDPSCSLR